MTNFKKYLILSLSFALINAVVLLVFFVPRFDHSDTPQYISTIQYLSGEPGSELVLKRIICPLPVLIGSIISPLFGVENTLIAQNIVFYFLSAWLVFSLIYKFYHNEKQAFYGTIIYAGSFPILAYGLASLTDMAGYFFYLVSVFIGLKFIKNPKLKTALLAGFVAGLGLLFKESVAAAPIFFVSIVFIATKLPLKDKFKYIMAFGVAFLLLPAINSIALYGLYEYSYYHTYRGGGLRPDGFSNGYSGFYMVSWARILIEIVRVMMIGWLFVLLGGFKEFVSKNTERFRFLLALILPSLSAFLWCYPHNRMLFIGFPFFVLLGSFGILRSFRSRKLNLLAEGGLLSLYVIFNYAVLAFLLDYGIYFWKFGDFS
ncbi:MAG: glycosyltransferase family 39 protein [Candidatus Portnoybacteria bacterium]